MDRRITANLYTFLDRVPVQGLKEHEVMEEILQALRHMNTDKKAVETDDTKRV